MARKFVGRFVGCFVRRVFVNLMFEKGRAAEKTPQAQKPLPQPKQPRAKACAPKEDRAKDLRKVWRKNLKKELFLRAEAEKA